MLQIWRMQLKAVLVRACQAFQQQLALTVMDVYVCGKRAASFQWKQVQLLTVLCFGCFVKEVLQYVYAMARQRWFCVNDLVCYTE